MSVVLHPVGRELVRHAGRPDAGQADEDLDEVVEAGGSEVLHRRGAHDELVFLAGAEEAEMPVVLDAREVE